MDKRVVEDFFDTEYRDYALYTIKNRAIPSAIDGFKPAQRKIAFAADRLWKTGNEKPLKVFQLGGQAAALAFYHHGSLDQTIITMTQDFKNSLPIFEGIGQFGSLRAPEAGAPRYVGVRFNTNFRRLYKDFDLVTPQEEEGEVIEPKFYLPIIPTVLLNGGSGIAVGFATNILNRHPTDLIDACVEHLKTGQVTAELRPWIKGFHGNVTPVPGSNGRGWVFHGVHEVKNTSTVEITEIPPSFTYEKYEAHLDNLVEKGVIHSYDDKSANRVRYILKFPRVKLADTQDKDKLEDTLKLRESATENITTLDEHGRLRVFGSAQELVRYFVEFRLTYYDKRKQHLLQEIDHDLRVLEGKAKFIQAVVEGTLVLAGRPKSDIVAQIPSLRVPTVDGGYDYLLSMPLYSLTRERHEDLRGKQLPDKRAERAKVDRATPKEMYLADLADLKRQLLNKGKWAPPAPPEVSPAPKHTPAEQWLREGAEAARPKKPSSADSFGGIFDLFGDDSDE